MKATEKPRTAEEIKAKPLGERLKLAMKRTTTAEVLSLLAKDKNLGIRYTVAKHKNTPIDVLKTLSEDKNKGVRNNATKRLKELEQ